MTQLELGTDSVVKFLRELADELERGGKVWSIKVDDWTHKRPPTQQLGIEYSVREVEG